jgi:periplasmic mercuric ion binding protein
MKKYSLINLLLIGVVVLIASCAGNPDEKASSGTTDDTSIRQENVQTIVLTVEGMTCSGCEVAIVNSLTRIEGVSHADASHTEGTASVSFDPDAVNIEDLQKAVEEAGYKAGNAEVIDK